MITRIDLPGLIERGRDTAITLDVYSDAGSQQTATAATLALYDGSEEIVAAGTAATSLGPPASYTVPAATTSSRALSAKLLAVWTLTIGGTDYVFRQPVQLVRHLLYPVITDEDLIDVHSDLDSLRDATNNPNGFDRQRALAFSRMQRWLINKGNRPALVIDPTRLKDWHVFETLHVLFRDWPSSLGDPRYTELAADYREQAKAARDSLSLVYDEDEDGFIGDRDTRAASPTLWLSRPYWLRGSL